MSQPNTVKKLDSNGRITLPKEIREHLKLDTNDPVRISIEDNRIIVEKFHSHYLDLFDNMVVGEPLYCYNGKKIARSSIIELASIAGLIDKL